MKICSHCKKILPSSRFYSTTKKYPKDGYRSACKKCVNAQNRKSSQLSRERKRREAKKKCKFCGEKVKDDRFTFCSNRCARKYEFKNPENHPNWQGGLSHKGYPHEFDEVLKEKIREKFHYICQDCGRTQKEELKEFGRKLAVNHIDHNRNNCSEDNLNILCGRCNIKEGHKFRKAGVNSSSQKINLNI